MAKRVVQEEAFKAFEAKSSHVLAQHAAESIQHMSQAELQRLKSLLGHGEGRKPMPEEEKLRFLPLIFASVSKDDVNAMPLSASTKQVVFAEMKRMHAASTRGLWMDAPHSGVDIKKSTRVSGKAEATQPEILRAPHLPLGVASQMG